MRYRHYKFPATEYLCARYFVDTIPDAALLMGEIGDPYRVEIDLPPSRNQKEAMRHCEEWYRDRDWER